jgi:hypothetical protein
MAECSKCRGTGRIACRSRDGQYAFPGPVPDDAKGYFEATCYICEDEGRINETRIEIHNRPTALR